jgi:hypothetical protein
MRLILTSLISCAILIGSALCLAPAEAQLGGHGGPIRALAISADGATALSGGFDALAIRWSLWRNTAGQVLRFHEGSVNAVTILADGRAVTAGEAFTVEVRGAFDDVEDISAVPTPFTPARDGRPLATTAGASSCAAPSPAIAVGSTVSPPERARRNLTEARTPAASPLSP